MSEEIIFDPDLSREEKYVAILPQVKSILEQETDLVANLANFTAILKEVFGFLWIGFYLVKNDSLVLGPFQGPLACTRIAFGKGVCGASWKLGKALIVPDVEKFPGHIACSSKSRSEIVVPLIDGGSGEVWGVLDVDSENLSEFGDVDLKYLSELTGNLKQV